MAEYSANAIIYVLINNGWPFLAKPKYSHYFSYLLIRCCCLCLGKISYTHYLDGFDRSAELIRQKNVTTGGKTFHPGYASKQLNSRIQFYIYHTISTRRHLFSRFFSLKLFGASFITMFYCQSTLSFIVLRITNNYFIAGKIAKLKAQEMVRLLLETFRYADKCQVQA